MNDLIKRVVASLETLSGLKKAGIFNPVTAKMLIAAHLSPDLKEYEMLNNIIHCSNLLTSPFNKPDCSVDGLIKFGKTENNIPVGINLEECHILITGQTGCGKTTLFKIIFAQALLLNKE